MNISTLFLIIPYLIVVTECCMRMVPPDDVYIPSTLAPEESTMAPVSTMTPGGLSTSAETEAPEVTMMTTPAMESTTEEVCRTMTNTCPDLSITVEPPMMIEDVDGCLMFSCAANELPVATGVFAGSELTNVPAPPGYARFSIVPPLSAAELNNGIVNDYFGLLCENNMLMTSKYPQGIDVDSIEGADGSLNGKKAPVDYMSCQ